MENTPHTNPFDAMLKQSLENSQMPVPQGAWESVASSLGAQAVVATKVAGLKLLLFKSVAGLIISGGLGLGIYQLMPTSDTESKTIAIKKDLFAPITPLSLDTFFEANAIPAKRLIKRNPEPKNDSALKLDLNPDYSYQTAELGEGVKPLAVSAPEIIKIHDKDPISYKPSEIKNENTTVQEPVLQPVNTAVFPEPANVFTPDGDGINDYFYIVVENEKLFNLQIFDEQGHKVFETSDKNKYWDGKNSLSGEVCKPGLYTYTYYYELNSGFKKKDRSKLTLY